MKQPRDGTSPPCPECKGPMKLKTWHAHADDPRPDFDARDGGQRICLWQCPACKNVELSPL